MEIYGIHLLKRAIYMTKKWIYTERRLNLSPYSSILFISYLLCIDLLYLCFYAFVES